MKRKVFTVERPPFLTIALFFLGLAFGCYKDFRKALPQSADFNFALTLLIIFLVFGTLSIGLYIGFIIAERNIDRNLQKTKGTDSEPAEV
jgi:hypothetical protein